MLITTLLVFGATFLLSYFLFRHRTPKNLPPGPFRWPIFGSLPYFTGDIRERFKELGRKYGDVYTIYIGSKRTVVLNSYESTKEAFVKHGAVFSGRPQDLFFVEYITKGLGVISSEGKLWQEQRRLCHRILRDFGLGKNIMAERIMTEVAAYLKEMDKYTDKPFDPSYLTQCAVGNLIYSVIWGKRYEYDDPVFTKYMKIMNESFELCGTAGPLNVFPFLKYLPGDVFGFKKLMEYGVFMDSQFNDEIEKHKSNITSIDEPADFTDAYIQQMEAEKDNPETTLTDINLLRCTGDLTGAGAETTTNTIKWIFIYLLHHPDIMEHLQKDIDDVIGTRTPSMADKVNLPYVEAFINEIHRIVCVVPLGVPHSVTEDAKFRGYTIPKGTTIISIMTSIHSDEETWDDPHEFKPERFLDENGQLINTEKLIPFSVGKRLCLGEALARMEIFLMVTSLLQRFSFHPVEGEPLPSKNGIIAITHVPVRFKMIVKLRKAFDTQHQ